MKNFRTALIAVFLSALQSQVWGIHLGEIRHIFYDPHFMRHGSYGVGARAIGMGGAFTALADDASAVYWNPAGLVQVPYWMASVGGAPIYFEKDWGIAIKENPMYGFMSVSFPLAENVNMAFGSHRLVHPKESFYPDTTGFSTNVGGEVDHIIDSNNILSSTFQAQEIFGTFAAKILGNKAFSLGLTVKRVKNDPLYLHYTGDDDAIRASLDETFPAPAWFPSDAKTGRPNVSGWGADLGFLYRISLNRYSREVQGRFPHELRVGVRIRDMISRIKHQRTVEIRDSNRNDNLLEGISASPPLAAADALVTPDLTIGKGLEVDIPQVVTLAVAYRNWHLFGLENITAFDFDQINDLTLDPSENKYIHAGTEFWALGHRLGIRGGYESPLSRPGRISVGGTYRNSDFRFEVDLALVFYLRDSALLERASNEVMWLTLSYWWGYRDYIPPPRVSARAEPTRITPALSEKVVFKLNSSKDTGIRNWELAITDSSGSLVRKFEGRDILPDKIVWSGEDQTFQPLDTGKYVFTLRVTDKLGKTSPTEPKSVQLLPPDALKPNRYQNPSRLMEIRDQQDNEAQVRRNSLMQEALRRIEIDQPATEPPVEEPDVPAEIDEELYPVSAAPGANITEPAYVASFSFPGLGPENVLSSFISKDDEDQKIFSLNYRVATSDMGRILDQAAQVVESALSQIGGNTLDRIDQTVHYGGNELFIATPVGAATALSLGRISRDQMLSSSTIYLNGEVIEPSLNP